MQMATGSLLRSTIGRKVAMAGTGALLVGFVLAHMIGNLQVYLGPAALNAYAVFLRELLHGAGIWIARAGLLAAAAVHVWAAWSLTRESRRARPAGYRRLEPEESTLASRTMRWGGLTLLLFVVYHLLHLTSGTVHPDFIAGDIYHNVVAGFEVLPVSLFYLLANVALGLHLYHGVWSGCRTLGLSHPRHTRLAKAAGAALAVVVAAGNISVPLAVLAGIVR